MKTLPPALTALTLAAVMFATGCATSQPQMTPTGEPGHFINCSGEQSWNACFRKAAEICPDGYRTHSRDSARTDQWLLKDGDLAVESGVQRTMLISCR